MASQQARRENKTDEREIHVEKDKVPKMASHFESLTVKDSGDQQHVIATMHGAAGGIHDQSDSTQQGTTAQSKGPSISLEEVSMSRGNAQQNSMDAIRAAEDKYQKAKEGSGQMNQQTRGGQQTKKNVESAARVSDYTVVKGQQAKESISSAAQTAAEKAARAKDYTLEKGQQAKESLTSAAQITAEKAAMAKDTTVDVTKKGATYIGEKAVAAKDVALETGKTTAGYVGKVAGVVKDKAVVTGWSAAEYASDKAVGATQTMAKATAGVVGLAGDTVLATNDVLADVGKKTKDVVVSTEETLKDYAARKKAEKQRELEAKNSKGEGESGDFENQYQSRETNSAWGGEGQEGGIENEWGDRMMEEGDFQRQRGLGFEEEQQERGGGGAVGL